MDRKRVAIVVSLIATTLLLIACIPIEGGGIDEGSRLETTERYPAEGDQDAVDLEGTGWLLRASNSDNRSEDGQDITIQFADGRVEGFAGCNQFFGDYTLVDKVLTIGPLGATRMMCPDDIMQREHSFLESLGKAESVAWQENSLQINSGENEALSFVRHQIIDEDGLLAENGVIIDLDGTEWKLRAFNLNDEWVEVLESTEITLNFADGGISGSAGCNNYFGSYTVDGTSLSLGNMGMSMMACDEGVMQQESLFLEALSSVQSYEWAENTLMIQYGDNVSLVFDRN